MRSRRGFIASANNLRIPLHAADPSEQLKCLVLAGVRAGPIVLALSLVYTSAVELISRLFRFLSDYLFLYIY